jgi:hypothetical protein
MAALPENSVLRELDAGKNVLLFSVTLLIISLDDLHQEIEELLEKNIPDE